MPNPGDIVVADVQGAMEKKRRPAVVVSSADYHSSRPDIIIGIITSNVSKAKSSTDYVLKDWQDAGLARLSAFRAFLVTLPAKDCRVIGKLSAVDWKNVQHCLRSALEITDV